MLGVCFSENRHQQTGACGEPRATLTRRHAFGQIASGREILEQGPRTSKQLAFVYDRRQFVDLVPSRFRGIELQ